MREKLAESREQAAAAQAEGDSLDAYLTNMVEGERKHDQDVAKKRLKEIAAAKSKLMPLIALVSPALRKSFCQLTRTMRSPRHQFGLLIEMLNMKYTSWWCWHYS